MYSQGDECLNLLKSISPFEAEITVDRLSLWARIALQDSSATSEEVLSEGNFNFRFSG